jgi:outer membrane autotransporter protein
MQGSFGLVHAELGIRANLSQTNAQSKPYLMAAIGKRAIGARITDFDEDDVYDLAFSGTMLSFGGGLQYLLSPKLALDGGVELGLGAFDHYDADGDIGSVSVNASTTIRVRAGVVWRP